MISSFSKSVNSKALHRTFTLCSRGLVAKGLPFPLRAISSCFGRAQAELLSRTPRIAAAAAGARQFSRGKEGINGPIMKHGFSTATNVSKGIKTEDLDMKPEEMDDDESSLIVNQFKNRMVHELWKERARAKKAASYTVPKGGNCNCPIVPGFGKTPCESETKVEYPFSTNGLLAESYRNPWGKMRIGRLLEDLDALAGNIAFYHVRQHDENGQYVHPLIVTASVDRIQLRKPSPDVTQDQVLSGRVTFVGTSSMEIRMQCTGAGEEEEWLEAYFTFVTLDPLTKKPMQITPLLPQTDEEKADFEAGAQRAKLKKERRKQHLKKQHPNNPETTEIERLAEVLLQEARPLLLDMPSLVGRDSILMSATKMQNALMAQPQVRNLHNRIFGGFLMRRAFELAFANSYVFAGARPVFREVDEISFAAPVDVGDLLVFNSRVLYTSNNIPVTDHEEDLPLVHVEVEAWVTYPETADAKMSNQFYFTFALEDYEMDAEGQGILPMRQILPANIDEATRIAMRMEADRIQAEHDHDGLNLWSKNPEVSKEDSQAIRINLQKPFGVKMLS
jgi:acyl-coenzyme A thioesterase 9